MPAIDMTGTPEVVEPVAPAGTEIVSDGKVTKVTATQPEPKPETKKEDRPAWLPEKFKTAEDFAASYKELETKLGTPAAKPADAPAPTVDETASKAIAAAGIDMTALAKEYTENNGALKPETLEALKAKGLPPETVNTYIKGQEARAEIYTNKMAEVVGGRDNMKALFAWATTNMPEAEIKAFNAVMTSFDEPMATLALQGLSARYARQMGTDPKLISGVPGARSNDGPKPFKSNAEVVQAMGDKRYKTGDKAYVAEVAARLNVTEIHRMR